MARSTARLGLLVLLLASGHARAQSSPREMVRDTAPDAELFERAGRTVVRWDGRECDLGEVAPSRGSVRFHRSPDGLLLTWGAGTFVAVAVLCRADGSVGWWDGAALSVAPDGAHLLVYTPAGAPSAERGGAVLVSLRDGRERRIDGVRVSRVVWRARALVLTSGGRTLTRPL